MHEDRLALVVAAQVATIRADEARERNGALIDGPGSIGHAFATFEARHGHPYDSKNRRDHRLFVALLDETGAAKLTYDDVRREKIATEECRALDGAAVEAMDAMTAAWKPGDGRTVLEWIGCTSEQLRAAVEHDLEHRN